MRCGVGGEGAFVGRGDGWCVGTAQYATSCSAFQRQYIRRCAWLHLERDFGQYGRHISPTAGVSVHIFRMKSLPLTMPSKTKSKHRPAMAKKMLPFIRSRAGSRAVEYSN